MKRDRRIDRRLLCRCDAVEAVVHGFRDGSDEARIAGQDFTIGIDQAAGIDLRPDVHIGIGEMRGDDLIQHAAGVAVGFHDVRGSGGSESIFHFTHPNPLARLGVVAEPSPQQVEHPIPLEFILAGSRNLPFLRLISKALLSQWRIDFKSDRVGEGERSGGAADIFRITPQQEPVRSESPQFPIEGIGARLLEEVMKAVAGEGFGRLIRAAEIFRPVFCR